MFYFKLLHKVVHRIILVGVFLLFSICSISGYQYNSYFKGKHKLIDFPEMNAISEVLALSNKKFGGFICHSWPRFRIINHHFGKTKQTSFKYFSQSGRATFKLKQNHCIFWQNSKRDREILVKVMGGVGSFRIMEHYRKLAGLDKQIEEFRSLESNLINVTHLGYYCN